MGLFTQDVKFWTIKLLTRDCSPKTSCYLSGAVCSLVELWGLGLSDVFPNPQRLHILELQAEQFVETYDDLLIQPCSALFFMICNLTFNINRISLPSAFSFQKDPTS